MMDREYRLLIIGNILDNHILRFIRNLKLCNNNVIIDVLTINNHTYINKDTSCLINQITFVTAGSVKKRRIISIFLLSLKVYRKLRQISKHSHYDIVNIHYPTIEYVPSVFLLKKMGKLVLTPWGSDVYRINRIRRILLRYLYKKADFVTGSNSRFIDDFSAAFEVDNGKIVLLNIGSDTIDYIAEHKNSITTSDAKQYLGVENKYTITCGYNASPSQNHKIIINSIYRIKENLPDNYLLLFPVTYGGDIEYIEELKALILEKQLHALFFESYLGLQTLFFLRMASDLFIHIQKTDAACASLTEYALCKNKIINGSWLQYELFNSNKPIPYYVLDDVNNLDECIKNAINSNPIKISDSLISAIEDMGWKKSISKWNAFFISIAATTNE